MKGGDLVKYGLLALGGYLAWQWLSKNNPFSPSAPIPAAAGGALFDVFGPSTSSASQTMYRVNFPDGSTHYVPAASVMTDGTFPYGGTIYALQTNADGSHTAIPSVVGGLPGGGGGFLDLLGSALGS